MKTMELPQRDERNSTQGDVVHLPLGLLGFEQVKNYSLLTKPDEEPFMWFQMDNAPHKAFLVISPFLPFPEYQPDLSAADVEFLGLTAPQDALLLTIVTLKREGGAVINLKGPIVINQRTLIGKQVIPNNACDYALNHPLPVS